MLLAMEIIFSVVNSLQFHESFHTDFSPATLEIGKLDNILIWRTVELQSSIIWEWERMDNCYKKLLCIGVSLLVWGWKQIDSKSSWERYSHIRCWVVDHCWIIVPLNFLSGISETDALKNVSSWSLMLSERIKLQKSVKCASRSLKDVLLFVCGVWKQCP